jgi:hypothetical protein
MGGSGSGRRWSPALPTTPEPSITPSQGATGSPRSTRGLRCAFGARDRWPGWRLCLLFPFPQSFGMLDPPLVCNARRTRRMRDQSH